ncbi:MAG: hypothetical protein UX26_C0027G0006 [Parcubacteria group bacterium GW2011_GWC1_45_9]|nr:MAG: hypothetical protein UX26_C0027G0006 [Parcubacteria group bacterium GW2011_GWC1_45_9]HCI05358.1 hypothetical protein [Patescibacteria group bacterium]
MPEQSLIKTKAVEIISDYMGEDTAKMYSEFYQTQSDDVILVSITQLMTEYVGDVQTKEILENKGLINKTNHG